MGELRAVDVQKTYGETEALSGVSLTLTAGEVYGLVGPNGAGKTTFVRGVTGTTPVEGTVELFGRPPSAVDRGRIGVLPQSFTPASRLTAGELVAYYAGLYDDARQPAAVLREVGLHEAADTPYESLSGGQRRRLCVATALVNDPELLVVDEPTTGIDPVGRRAVWRVIERLAADGTGVLLTSHSMTEIERLADRVGLLRAGELVAAGTPAELIDRHAGPPRLRITVGARSDRADAVPMHAPESTPTAVSDEMTGVSDGTSGERSEAGGERSETSDERFETTSEHSETAGKRSETSDDPSGERAGDATLTQQAANRLSAAGYATATETNTVTVEGVTPTEIAAVVDRLHEPDPVPVRSITWREPGLEDAYLRLTGEPFDGERDEPLEEERGDQSGTDSTRADG